MSGVFYLFESSEVPNISIKLMEPNYFSSPTSFQ